MTRTCATPGCSTLTFGEVCLGCLQRAGDVRRNEDEREDDGRSTEDAAAAAAA